MVLPASPASPHLQHHAWRAPGRPSPAQPCKPHSDISALTGTRVAPCSIPARSALEPGAAGSQPSTIPDRSALRHGQRSIHGPPHHNPGSVAALCCDTRAENARPFDRFPLPKEKAMPCPNPALFPTPYSRKNGPPLQTTAAARPGHEGAGEPDTNCGCSPAHQDPTPFPGGFLVMPRPVIPVPARPSACCKAQSKS